MNAQIHLIASASGPVPELYGEADHRIANSLASISALVRIAARHGQHQDPVRVLLETADRIESVAALHRHVAHSPAGAIWPRCFLEDLCARMRAAVTDGDLAVKISFRNERQLPADIVLTLGLVTLELLSNSIKYAHPASTPLRVEIRASLAPTHLQFSYEDDGVGFPEGFDVAHSGNLGMRYLSVLSQKLGATPEWESSDLGVRFTLRVPL